MSPYQRALLISQGRCPRLYDVWRSLRNRCNNPKSPDYHRYGGRGITVDPAWEDFDTFAADVGAHPGDGYSIDRIRNNEGYRGGNTHWATRAEQGQNRRSTKLSIELVAQIRLLKGRLLYYDIAGRVGVDKSQISKVMNGRQW